ncbi:MAG: right-handed parallel beta-helix repeat-containing protein [Microthrixaceae bacterium]
MSRRRFQLLATIVAAVALVAGACSSADDGAKDNSKDTGANEPATLAVPAKYKTIQEAVDAASPGDLVLVSPGTYKEAVNVSTENITIRGLDRNKVILDGEFKLENGIRVLESGGVVIENMTARNYTSNGFFWTGVDGYRGSYLTAYRNGDYGVYAFDSVNGQLDNSYASGSPDAGFYIGECYKCNALIDNVVSEYNGLGYSGTNSGGDLYILNSTFRFNRAGIVPNSGSYELCYPERKTTVVGNLVHSNNQQDAPGISVSLLAMGNGILVAGGVQNTVERNLVWDHDRTGIGLVPFPEEDANDLPPAHTEWDTPCSETADKEVPPIPADKCKSVEGLLKGCVVFWNPFDNVIKENVIEDSRVADLAVGTVDLLGTGETTETLGNCFSDNTFKVSAPIGLEDLAPCGSDGNNGDWNAGALDLLNLMGNPAPKPPDDTYHKTPIPAEQDNMPKAATAAPAGGFKGPQKVDVSKIAVPEKPADA